MVYGKKYNDLWVKLLNTFSVLTSDSVLIGHYGFVWRAVLVLINAFLPSGVGTAEGGLFQKELH